MKKVLKKFLIALILVVILFENVFSCNVSFAAYSAEEVIDLVSNLIGGLVSIAIWIPKLETTGIVWVMNRIVVENIANVCGVTEGWTLKANSTITPFEIFFGKYTLLDINFFDMNPVHEGSKNAKMVVTMRSAVAGWYYILRTIAAAILLVILIYVGIRMAVSTIASEKARYSKMLVDWVASLALIFVLHYFCVYIIYLNNAIVHFLKESFEEAGLGKVIDDIVFESLFGIGMSGIMAFLVYIMIEFQTLAFLCGYITRMIKIGFLILISPLITLTYSLDKMGDGKAQALGNWMKEFVYSILIQPFHCIMYVTFVNAAAQILTHDGSGGGFIASDHNELANGILAILCLKFINDGEKVIRKIFNFSDDNSGTSMAAGAAVGIMAVNRAKQIGSSTSSTIKKVANSDKFQKVTSGLKMDAQKLKNSDNIMLKRMGKATEIAEKAINNPVTQKIGQGLDKAKRGINGVRGRVANTTAGKVLGRYHKQSAAVMAGMVTAAAMYATGDTSALEAFGGGAAAFKGSKEFLNNSTNGQTDSGSSIASQIDEAEYKELGDKANSAGQKIGKQLGDDVTSEEFQEEKENAANDYNAAKSQLDAKDQEINAHQAKRDQLTEEMRQIEKARKANGYRKNKTGKQLEKDYANKKKEIAEATKKMNQLQSERDALELKANGKKEILDAYNEFERLSTEYNDFFSDDSIKLRNIRRAEGISSEDMKSAEREIMATVMAVLAEKNNKSVDDFTDEEKEDASIQSAQIIAEITRNAYSERTIDGKEAANQKMLENFGMGSNDDMKAVTAEYMKKLHTQQFADIYQAHSQLGGSSAQFHQDVAEKVRGINHKRI